MDRRILHGKQRLFLYGMSLLNAYGSVGKPLHPVGHVILCQWRLPVLERSRCLIYSTVDYTSASLVMDFHGCGDGVHGLCALIWQS